MEKCLFCEIVAKKIPSFIIYEDNFSVAFLDINPRSRGMTLVAPRKHYSFFDEDLNLSTKVFQAAMLVARKLQKALNPSYVAFSILRAEVPHFHLRLYPVYKEQLPLLEANPIRMEEKELRELAESIKGTEILEETKEERGKEERSEEEVRWIRRYREMA